jgi:hypothetical protein
MLESLRAFRYAIHPEGVKRVERSESSRLWFAKSRLKVRAMLSETQFRTSAVEWCGETAPGSAYADVSTVAHPAVAWSERSVRPRAGAWALDSLMMPWDGAAARGGAATSVRAMSAPVSPSI